MQQLRRIETPPPADAYARTQRGLLRNSPTITEAEFRALKKKNIVEDGDAILFAVDLGHVIEVGYAFPDRVSFGRLFPPMFERLLPAIASRTATSVRFTLTDTSSRNYVQPALDAHAFEHARDWIEMAIEKLPAARVGANIARGFVLRPAQASDIDDIIAIDVAVFPPPPWTGQKAMVDVAARKTLVRVIEDTSSARVAGFLRLQEGGPDTGHISDLAVHPDYQRRGLGEAMLRWSFATFREQGLRRATLSVNPDNASAIALYRKLGMAPGLHGIDYHRPVDEDEVRQVLEKRLASHIRVRKRY